MIGPVEPQVLMASRRALAGLAGMGVLASILVALRLHGDWKLAPLGVLLLIVAFWAYVTPRSLEIDDEGFTMEKLLRFLPPRAERWTDSGYFAAARGTVTYRVGGAGRKHRLLACFTLEPGHSPLTPEELAALLNKRVEMVLPLEPDEPEEPAPSI
jgi:hypothetical protein